MRIAGLILAGGAGSRMGGADKARILLAGRPLIAHVTDRFLPQVDSLAVSARAGFAWGGLPVIADAQEERLGPLAGVAAGLAWAQAAGADALATVPVDTPFLPCDLVARLCQAAEGHGGMAIAETAEGPHPTCALWPAARAAELAALVAAGERRLRRAAGAAGLARFGSEAEFLNVNTPEDLLRAEAMLA